MRLSLVLCALLGLLGWAGWQLAAELALPLRLLSVLALPLLVAVVLTVLGALLAELIDRSGARARGVTRLRLWARESLAFGWCFLIAQPLLAWFMPRRDPLTVDQCGQLLLVHGFVCNRGLWWRWRGALRTAGWRTAVIDLPPTWWRIETQLALLEAEIRALRAEAPTLPLWIIGHSMGGLAARMLQQRITDFDLQVICLGAPHHGTQLAGGFGGRRYGPPLPSSEWLCEFNGVAGALPAASLNLWSVDEAIVVPAHSCRLDPQRDEVWRGYGHMGLCQSSAVLEVVLSRLRG